MTILKIEIDEDQYRNLVRLLYIGRYVVGSAEEENKKYGSLEQNVYSSYLESNLGNWVTYNILNGKYSPTAELEKEVLRYLDDFGEESFWEELTWRLAERDIFVNLGEEKFNAMGTNERLRLTEEHAKIYEEEFRSNGLLNLLLAGKI